jgi:DNA-binding transcriptional MerR regulator
VTAGMPTEPSYLSIGEVLTRLRTNFPDVTISKIRFLESEGLVEPERTRAGYRQFSSGDVERLHFILECQRDRYLPLRVIREHLAALDRGEEPTLPAGPATGRSSSAAVDETDPSPQPAAPAAESGATDELSPPRPAAAHRPRQPEAELFASDLSELRLNRRELAAAAGLRPEQLTELERYGLVATRSGGSHYDGEALIVARTVAAMSRYGLEPRHLRAFKTAADREVGLIEQVISPYSRARGGDARKHAATVARELAALSLRLHTALVRAGLSADLLR